MLKPNLFVVGLNFDYEGTVGFVLFFNIKGIIDYVVDNNIMRNTDINQFHLLCSNRKNIRIEVLFNGSVYVYAPENCDFSYLCTVLEKKRYWIEKKRIQFNKAEKYYSECIINSDLIKTKGRNLYKDVIRKAKYYSEITGLKYRTISITSPKKRWGSCNSRGDIIYNWKVVLLPDNVRDYIILHEIIHLRVFNHSTSFYNAVQEFYPDYKNAVNWLRIYGNYYLQRLSYEEELYDRTR